MVRSSRAATHVLLHAYVLAGDIVLLAHTAKFNGLNTLFGLFSGVSIEVFRKLFWKNVLKYKKIY